MANDDMALARGGLRPLNQPYGTVKRQYYRVVTSATAAIYIGQPMDLAFTSFEVVAIVLATMITRELIQDGKANWFEGVLLLAVYTILAIGFFHLPE